MRAMTLGICRSVFLSVSLPVLLSACMTMTPEGHDAERGDPTISDKSAPVRMGRAARVPVCEGLSSPNCRFRNSPVRLAPEPVRLPRRALVFYPTMDQLEFYDVQSRRWIAPRRTLTDGASIPLMFVDMIGAPLSRQFANAAAIHDAYCGVGNEAGPMYHAAPWRAVHRMFYDALRVGGTPEITAKVMFAAVYIGGPRWAENPGPRVSSQGAVATWGTGGSVRDTLSRAQLRQVMRHTRQFIEARNPGLGAIELYAEEEMRRQRWRRGTGEGGAAGVGGGLVAPPGEAPVSGEEESGGQNPGNEGVESAGEESDAPTGEAEPSAEPDTGAEGGEDNESDGVDTI